uniref:E3 ubiquitin-protein ligase RNF4 isoform X2 n=1 Tax=Castor canadensis TaxID=51338 RepID=A0A8B7UFG1_CASCN|nr:E3 ubiquitin-protein ligase RNF4 isoform X2 [Castor canadensis]
MSTRKRRGGTVSSRQSQKRTREATSTPEISLEAEPIELVETAGDEIVDLTCESLEPVVVDLTHNDSVVIVEERRRPRRNARRLRQDHADSCVVSSDDEEFSRDRDVYVTTHTPRGARDQGATGLRSSGTVSCPICMDGYSECDYIIVCAGKPPVQKLACEKPFVEQLQARLEPLRTVYSGSFISVEVSCHMPLGYVYFSPAASKTFCLCFQQFGYDMFRYDFACIYLAWGSLNLKLWVDKFWRIVIVAPCSL